MCKEYFINVMFSYEIQLTPEVRRKGLGKFLIQILELLAFKLVNYILFAILFFETLALMDHVLLASNVAIIKLYTIEISAVSVTVKNQNLGILVKPISRYFICH